MPSKKTPSDTSRQDQIIAEARRHRKQQEQTYRAKALNIYPHICARCGREFSGKSCVSLRFITGTMTMTTIRLMAATGNCCACTVMTMSTPATKLPRRMQSRNRTVGKPRPRSTGRLRILRLCSKTKKNDALTNSGSNEAY